MSAFASNSRDTTSSARLPVSRNSCGKEGAMSLSGGGYRILSGVGR